ncbi:MAG: PKD domain-containing protein [Bacteroidota bacterium]
MKPQNNESRGRTVGRSLGILVMAFLCSLITLRGQDGKVFDWARQGAGDGWKHGNAIAVDNDGNSFVVGEFAGAGITFQGPLGPSVSNPYTISNDRTDAFIAMYDQSGILQWIGHPTVTSSGGLVIAKSVAVWSGANPALYVVGEIAGTVDFNSSNSFPVTADVGSSFIAKYTHPANSNVYTIAWVALAGPQAQNPGTVKITGVAVDNAGVPYLCGNATGSTKLMNGNPSAVQYLPLVSSSTTPTLFVAKYNVDGTPNSASIATGSGTAFGTAITMDGGNAIITGHFRGTVNFPNAPSMPLTGYVENDNLFVARCNPSTGFDFAIKVEGGTSSFVSGNGVAVDSDGKIYVAGTFQGTTTFGSFILSTSSAPNSGPDYFVARFNPPDNNNTGTWLWANRGNTGESSEAFGNAITRSSSGNIYVTGAYSGTMEPTSTALSYQTIALGSMGNHDIFVAKYDASGVLGWVQHAGNIRDNGNGNGNTTNHYDRGTGIGVRNFGNNDELYLCGEFGGTARFIGAKDLSHAHPRNVFVAKLSQSAARISGKITIGISTPVVNQIIKITDALSTIAGVPAVDYVTTGSDGRYTAYVRASSGYCDASVTVMGIGSQWYSSPTMPYEVNQTTNSANFILTSDTSLHSPDLYIELRSLSTEKAEQGKEIRYLITYGNRGNDTANGFSISFPHDHKLLSPALVTLTPYSYSSLQKVLGWGPVFNPSQIASLFPLTRRTIIVAFKDTVLLPVGDTLSSTASIIPDNGVAVNAVPINQDIVHPSDPNKKTVSPSGNISVLEVRAGQKLTYRVEFFNVGTGPVHHVIIYDVLDQRVSIPSNPATLSPATLVASSTLAHTVTGNTLSTIFDLPTANLPSIHTSPGSFGYVKFSVRLKTNLPVGEKIKNKATVEFVGTGSLATNMVENCVAADFKVTNTQRGEVTNFITHTVNPIDNYIPMWADSVSWNFGDGTSGTGLNVQHTYARAATYSVTMTFISRSGEKTLCDQKGVVFTVKKTVTITPVVIRNDPARNRSYPSTPR